MVKQTSTINADRDNTERERERGGGGGWGGQVADYGLLCSKSDTFFFETYLYMNCL